MLLLLLLASVGLWVADSEQVSGLGVAAGFGVHLPSWRARVLHAADYSQGFTASAFLDEGLDGWPKAAGAAVASCQ